MTGRHVLAGCAAALIALTALTALTALGPFLPHPAPGQFGIGYGVALDDFVAVACLQGLIYWLAVAVLPRRDDAGLLWFVLAVAVSLRVIVLLAPPFLSNDMYRYIWDGWVQCAGINPYRYIPADPHLAFLRDSVVYPNINRATYAHTIYPPAAEMIFFASAALDKILHLPPVLGLRLAMLALEAVAIWAMLRLLRLAGLPRPLVLIYAWNPLPLWEFAGNGHVDAIAVCFVALALLAAVSARPVFAGVALAIAVLAKFLPVVLVPAIWRWDWRFAGIFAAILVLLYLPYLGVGLGVFGFLGGYGAQEGMSSGHGIFLLAALGRIVPLPAGASFVFLGVLGALLAGVGARLIFGPAAPASPSARAVVICRRALLLAGITMLGLSPHYPWYYAWLLVPACIVSCPSVVYLVSASFLLYLNPTHTKLFWPAVLYVPFVLLAARDVLMARPVLFPKITGEAVR